MASRRTPPTASVSKREYQVERRARALEEQKRQRALRVNNARNLDLFASLSLEAAESSGEENNLVNEQDEIPWTNRKTVDGIGGLASMLEGQDELPLSVQVDNAEVYSQSEIPRSATTSTSRNRKPKNKKKKNSYANLCQYAELLELRQDDLDLWDIDTLNPPMLTEEQSKRRTFWENLQDCWVALAPIPKGKRCLAVSYAPQTQGHVLFTSTHLHSRVKGATFLKIPSPLPSNSILDCILDENWQQNGIIHVLDIIKWRGTDFADCEAEFRFWWRDARLSEIAPLQPHRSLRTDRPWAFDFPFAFLPVPYCPPPIPLDTYINSVIPAARTVRQMNIPIPGGTIDRDFTRAGRNRLREAERSEGSSETGMAVETALSTATPIFSVDACVDTDGLLLYICEASYQPGETPLSCWVPAVSLDPEKLDEPVMLQVFEEALQRQRQLTSGQ